jgi:hypothetical protein
MDDRIQVEYGILLESYPLAILKNRWIWLPDYPLPLGWNRATTPVCFFIRDTYLSAGPYGIHVPNGLLFNNIEPKSYADKAEITPFGCEWGKFSWEAEGWHPTTEPRGGHNLLTYVRGFAVRFKQGV